MAKSIFFGRCTKKAMAIILVLLQVISVFAFCFTANAATTENDLASRLINVVYDDSNSMIMGQSTAWSEAKYSLEILSAMMQEKDMMNVYFMSDYLFSSSAPPRISNISGAESQRQKNIEKIHNTVSDTSGTYFDSIVKAYNDLKSKGSSYDERHLVVLTDGNSFNGGEGTGDLDKLFKSAKGDGIKVIYLAIGEMAIKPTANEANGIYVYQATPNNTTGADSILNKVTQMGERIFQRPAHPTSGNKLSLKVPVSEIVVFAQGANVKIGDIAGAKKSLSTAGLTDKDVDKASKNPDNSQIKGIKNIRVAAGLLGAVATFTASSGDYIPEGEYTLDITATSYTVYYKPCLDVSLSVMDSDGNKIESGNEVNIGEYTAKYYLTYPEGHQKHGEELSLADLGINPQYILTVKNGSDIQNFEGPAPKTVSLKKGSTEIKVTANYLTYISTDESLNLAVEDLKIHELKVEINPPKKEYMLSELENDKEGFTVKVTSLSDEPLTPELWAEAKLTLTAEGLDFYEPVKNSDYTFTVRPKLKDGDYKKTASGDIPFKAGVDIEKKESKIRFKGTGEATVNIYNDVIADKDGFKITVLEKTEGIKSADFNGAAPTVKIEISWNGNPLTKTQYDALKLSAVMEDDLKVKDANGKDVSLVEISEIKLDPYKEGEKTTATIAFKANGDAETQRTKLGSHDDFVINAVLEMAGIKNDAKKEDSLDVSRTLSAAEILLIILIILAILFFLFGYIFCKKWLPTKIKYENAMGQRTFKPYKKLSTYGSIIIPFLGVTANMNVDYFDMDDINQSRGLKIRAKARRKATILNALELYDNGSGVYVDSDVKLSLYCDALADGRTPSKKPECMLSYNNSHMYDDGDDVVTFLGTK